MAADLERRLGPPRVSVVLPARNEERFIETAVASVLRQTFRDFELVVVDDGSTDGTAGVLARLAAADSRIRVLRLESLGLVEALNAGVAAARGAYVARMDADDVSLPERFARQVAELDRRPSLGVLGTRITYIDAGGRPVGSWEVPVGPRLVQWTLAFGTPIAHPSVMMRVAVLPDPPYTNTHPHAEDFDLWVRLSSHTTLDNLPEALVERRVHGSSVSDRNASLQDASTLRIRCRAIGAVLGNEPAAVDVAALNGPRSVKALLASLRLISRLYRASPRDAAVRRDAARRLISVIKAMRQA